MECQHCDPCANTAYVAILEILFPSYVINIVCVNAYEAPKQFSAI